MVLTCIILDRCKLIGRGCYGTVYEGTWMNRKVAVKRIQIENVENNKGEEEALQKLDHPNVVKLYHAESDSDFRYYALELCQLSLNQLFNGDEAQKNYQEKMPPEKEVCLQLAKGLEHIHEKRLIHRDIKPQNVFISVHPTDGGNVSMKWADFGLSSPLNDRGSFSTTEHNTRPDNWLAPEILQMKENFNRTTPLRQEGTIKSDVFSAGLIFGYYLLKGRHPYGSQFNIPANIVNDTPVNLKAIEEQKHPMHAVIMDMLKNNPNKRISSADVITRIANIS
ncbi:serine/threonine-protein kinase/endoribonuclease ire-1-like [Daphnia pulicaria]|uniref:serine/threonine-protein kinase/endoribonuclease ire-1-like n=1 Tax=Daphnia pulicaria TaxID=35523 RepID=UPI001EEB6D72|nr:serine/threonine-protein kinase/endoribonuclease ire-1-like [Daphnia pulicaria]